VRLTTHEHPGRNNAARALSVALLFFSGCGNTVLPAAIGPSSIEVAVVFTPVGDGTTYTAQLNGQTYTRAGLSIVNLVPGTYQMTGSFLGSGFTTGFQTTGNRGGVQSGSPRSLVGPSSLVASCGITYANSDARTVPQNFQLEFQVTADAGSACPGAPP
jgi:hypothetical protein